MVKYGKQYRQLQLEEWKKYYLDYKSLKHKIRQMKRVLVKDIKVNDAGTRPSLLSTPLLPEEIEKNKEAADLYNDNKGQHLKEFITLLISEFLKSYNFFISIEKVLIKKVNSHLYIQTSYSTYNLAELSKEMKSISLTIYLVKCLNAFINDIMMAIKKILKKFDKNFSSLYGLITPHIILKLLSKDKSELEYILQFKIIDEISIILERCTLELKRYFDQNNDNSNPDDEKNREAFISKYNDVLKYIKDIDELIYFKTQYKDWIDYISKKKYKKGTKYSENDIFNPILSASYYRDNLLDKFLSTKDAFNEIKNIQRKITLVNKRNIILILTQAFFYNSLLTCIFPVLFDNFNKNIEKKMSIILIFSIVGITYLGQWCSTFFFYNCMSIKKLKFSYLICYLLTFIGSLIYILSFLNNSNDQLEGLILGGSRFLIGLGANPMMGKKYLTLYTPKYLLPLLSKVYLIIELSGLILGPCITSLFYIKKNPPNFISSNCIGYYGAIVSVIMIIINQFFMISPGDQNFTVLENQTKEDLNISTSKYISNNFEDDDEQDKEFYKMQKEKNERKTAGLEPTRSDDVKIEVNDNEATKSNVGLGNTVSDANIKDEKEDDTDYNKILEGQNDIVENYFKNIDTERYSGVNLTGEQRDTIKEIEEKLYEYQEKSNFTYIDMMPRTLDDIILNEQKTFGYMNTNFIIILLLLFSNNLIKENLIIYSAFNIYKIFGKEYLIKICLLISAVLVVQLLSLFFIMPFYKVNLIFKKNLIIFMIGSIILMIPLLILSKSYVYAYIPIVSIDILIHKIIEVICSCFLVYLIPPQWQYAHIKASSLPLYLMTFGKIIASIFCFFSLINGEIKGLTFLYNNAFLILFSFCIYLTLGIIIYKSTNFRVKALARILRRKALE